jgi:hypothetical protein
MEGARIQVRDIGGIALVLIGGEIGVWNSASVLAAITASVQGYNEVILSLESCDNFTKRSTSLFLDLRERLGLVLVVVCNGALRRILAAGRIHEKGIPVTSSVEGALELLRTAGSGK